jgi:hypothetical protein
VRRRLAFAAAGLLLIAAAGWGFLAWRGHAPEEIARLVGEGDVRALREPLRPARGAPRVLLFALDGVGDGEMMRALASGAMPRTAALLGEPSGERTWAHGWAAPDVLSILPSTTYAAWASVFTGAPAGRTGVPGNEWFVREEMRFYAPAPVSVEEAEDAVRTFSEGLAGALLRVPTLYELAGVRSYVSMHGIHRGADVLSVPLPGVIAGAVAAAARGVVEEGSAPREA